MSLFIFFTWRHGIEEIYKVKEEKQYPGDIDIINMGGNEDLGRLSVL